MVKCSVCGAINPEGAAFCDNCGNPLVVVSQNATKKVCPNCGVENEGAAIFCTNCGYTFNQGQQEASRNMSVPPIQNQHQKQKKRVWPWLISGVVVLVLAVGGGYAIYANKQPQQDKIAGVSDSKQSSSNESDSEAASIAAENSSLKAKQKSNDDAERTSPVELNEVQKKKIGQDFLDWASDRAKAGDIAVSDLYFNHGSAGDGDWYANTPDGKIQVQNNDLPGADHFEIHALGGVVFYTSLNGTTGYDSYLATGSIADGYSKNMDNSEKVNKYLLGDNGVVYQLRLGEGIPAAPMDGFGELDSNGDFDSETAPNQDFFISKDEAAQTELQKLIKENS